jgi:hypothetical protein
VASAVSFLNQNYVSQWNCKILHFSPKVNWLNEEICICIMLRSFGWKEARDSGWEKSPHRLSLHKESVWK